MSRHFPLSAIAFQPQLSLALCLLATDPSIGGLLISGDRGAAKSTAARALAALMNNAPFVNLPLGATEDRLVGTLDLHSAFEGQVKLKPGLMAQADGGLLYIDEVNLLPDHLVDVLLDAAAMGIVRVERDGLSAQASARFALIGSMNPEEGRLRPQFLDRFAMSVEVSAPTEKTQRAEIIRRRMLYEQDSEAFTLLWKDEEARLAEHLFHAKQQLVSVSVSDHFLDEIAQRSIVAGVRSLRADVVMYRAAVAHAAWMGRGFVEEEDLDIVAPLVLNHRSEQKTSPSSPPSKSSSNSTQSTESTEQIFSPSAGSILPLHIRASRKEKSTTDGQGMRLEQPDQFHLPDSIKAMAGRGGTQLTTQDIRLTKHQSQGKRHVLFVVDSSGSIGIEGRMGAVKAAMLGALSGEKDSVAFITFRATKATLVLDWTSDQEAIETAITQAPTGGRTPLADALRKTYELLVTSHLRKVEVVVFSDGKANVSLQAGGDPWKEALQESVKLAQICDKIRVVDTEIGQVKLGRALQLAQALNASYEPLIV